MSGKLRSSTALTRAQYRHTSRLIPVLDKLSLISISQIGLVCPKAMKLPSEIVNESRFRVTFGAGWCLARTDVTIMATPRFAEDKVGSDIHPEGSMVYFSSSLLAGGSVARRGNGGFIVVLFVVEQTRSFQSQPLTPLCAPLTPPLPCRPDRRPFRNHDYNRSDLCRSLNSSDRGRTISHTRPS
jgi:hypothetical protein